MRLAVASIFVAAVVAAGTAGYLAGQQIGRPVPAEQIQEDDPRWDCHTMGNRICGKEQS